MFRRKARTVLHFMLLVIVFTSLLASPAGAARPVSSAPSAGVSQGVLAPQVTLAKGPNILDIPFTQVTPKIDGICTDYASGATRTFADGGGNTGTIYLIYTNTTLFVCMEAAKGSFDGRFAALYLDPQGDGINYVYANQGDYSFRVSLTSGATSSYSGNGGPNGWTLTPALDPAWSAAVFTGPTNESVEWALNFDLLNFGLNCGLFGLGVYHHWFSAVGDDYGWPSNQWFDQPRTWQLSRLERPNCGQAGQIAYVFRGNTADAVSFYNMLVGAGYTVDLIPLGNVLSIPDFSVYDLIMIADDSGSLDQWGTSGFTTQQVDRIRNGNKPIIGLGEGGYAFFGRLGLYLGWPNGWHGPQDRVNKAATAPPAYYNGLSSDPVIHYSAPLNSVGIYLGPNNSLVPGDATVIGLEDPTKDHAPLIMETCRLLWGNSGNPIGMTAEGRILFLNSVGYMRTFQCPPLNPTPPPPTCVKVDKTASPAPGSAVTPGTVITYTVTVTYSNGTPCSNGEPAKLIDSIPLDTTFVPGSATGGISPASDGSLNWTVNASAAPQTFIFKVVVDESQCNDQRQVNNRAGLIKNGFPPFISNVVSHPVNCPPILLPNDNPNFVEDEVQIHPYPLAVGHPSAISVRVTNLTASSQPVTVTFQTSPDKFGIGLSYSTFDTRSVTLPPSGSVIVQGIFVPVQQGHYCIQIVVKGPALATPLVTQRNLDVTENLVPGTPDILTFKVGNPTSNTATIQLVVVNTCPGWTAAITNPASGVLTGMAPNEVREAALTVTPPPAPALLGSGCHIDVEGWIGDLRIGGIRKLDLPPVNLPVGVLPPWEEPEISFIPDPPVLGRPNQLCIQLQNPLDVPKVVTVDFAAADFGAGIGFTPVGSLTLTLPPHSLNRYCVPWTPAATGTLHRCILVTLKQAGYQDMHSQRNVDLVRVRPGDIGTLDIPFVVHNPNLFEHTLGITLTVVGLDPYWHPIILTGPGGLPPDSIMGGQTLNLHLMFAAMAAEAAAAPPTNYKIGDVSQVEVGVYLDGELMSGFTVVLDTPKLYLPMMAR